MCFLADHGNVAWRAGLTIVASEANGQEEPVKLAHLLGKDSYNVLDTTVNPDLQMGFRLLQSSSLLVVGSGTVKECILVPRNAFINALASLIQDFFMERPNDRGNENQKLLVENDSWDEIGQTESFIFNSDNNSISGVSWQVSSREDVTKEFRDGKKVEFTLVTIIEVYPIILLGGEDTEWVSCAIEKENMAGQHCNHCQRSQNDFIEGLGEPWTIQKMKNAADHYRDEVLPAAAHLASKPAGYMGVKSHPMYSIPIHLWGSPFIHDELGLVKDWLTRLEKFADCRVEGVPTEEVATREQLVIQTNDLEDLLFATKELQPKESIKELEQHLARLEKEIEGRSRTCENRRTGQPTTIPGWVTQEEQRIVNQISLEITSWHETIKTIAEETKTAKEQIEKMAKQLKWMRDTTDLTEGSVEYTIDSTLCANGVDRKVYHGQCLIGPQIQKLLANRVTILSQL
jgi:hypothetical protein